jgi:hypothetical protein
LYARLQRPCSSDATVCAEHRDQVDSDVHAADGLIRAQHRRRRPALGQSPAWRDEPLGEISAALLRFLDDLTAQPLPHWRQ